MNLSRDIVASRMKALAARGNLAALPAERAAALDRFLATGWPSPTSEMFRYANLSRLYAQSWGFKDASSTGIDLNALVPDDRPRLVFVDGVFDPKASRASSDDGLIFLPLTQASAAVPPADKYENPFLDLNGALFTDGAMIHKKNDGRPTNLALVFFSTKGSSLISLKNIVTVESGATLTLTEIHAGDGAYFSNVFTHANVGPNADFRHTRIQRESTDAFHVGGTVLRQDRDSRVLSLTADFGGTLSRVDVAATLSAPGATCDVHGLYYSRDSQVLDHYTLIDHAREHCISNELFKGILDGRSAASFVGKVRVREGAQKTDSKQLNRNLVLSREAVAESLPQLEIFANDVKCSHGSTIGELDDNEIFYLRSRGMTQEQARRELIQAYALEILEFERDPAVRAYLEAHVQERLAA